jgi:D-glycero-D-manno-heptose 1,7-bisphosphate phosphatase
VSRPAVFLDRDGTIVREADYLRSPERLRLLPRAAEAIRRLNDSGFAVVVATNQSGIARGLLTEDDLAQVHKVLAERLAKRGARLDAIYFCPHHPTAGAGRYRRECSCRKPAPGMLLRAAQELDLDLSRCIAVGDSQRDLIAGREVGCRTVLVRTGYGRDAEAEASAPLPCDHVADDLAAAVQWILEQHGERSRR